MGVVKLCASMFQLVISGTVWILVSCESYLLKKMGADAGCEASSPQCSRDFQASQPKRKKLLVDIKMVDDQVEFVSATGADPKTSWLSISWILKPLMNYALKAVHFGHNILTTLWPKSLTNSQKATSCFSIGWIFKMLAPYVLQAINVGHNLLTTLDSQISSYLEFSEASSGDLISNDADTASRKMISPRKRLPQSKLHIVRRCIFQISNLFNSKPEGLIFDPIEGFGENNQNEGGLNGSVVHLEDNAKDATGPISASLNDEDTDPKVEGSTGNTKEEDHSSDVNTDQNEPSCQDDESVLSEEEEQGTLVENTPEEKDDDSTSTEEDSQHSDPIVSSDEEEGSQNRSSFHDLD